MIATDERCGRCGRMMPMREEGTQGGYQDAWRECANPKCVAAERAAEAAYWAGPGCEDDDRG